MGETADQDARYARPCQPPRQLPAWRNKTPCGHVLPRAAQILFRDIQAGTGIFLRQVSHAVAIDPVTAKRHRLRLERKRLLRFQPGRLHPQRCIEGGNSLGIEPAAMHSRTMPGMRCMRPSGVMRPEDLTRQPHA